MREHVGRRLQKLENCGFVVRKRNPGRKLRPRPHGALYIFEIDRTLLPDLPSLLEELSRKAIVERGPSKKKKEKGQYIYWFRWR